MSEHTRKVYQRAKHPHKMLDLHEVATKPSRVKRFWSRVERGDANACWLWRGGNVSHNGYALMQGCERYQKWSFGVHRIAWTLANGRTPQGVVMHLCDVPLCCNPAHLCDGSYRDNMRDASIKGRLLRLYRWERYPLELRAIAIERRRCGETIMAIARSLDVPWTTVQVWCSKAGLAKHRGPYADRRKQA